MEIINPKVALPVPNEYFFLVIGGEKEKQFIPAISRCYSNPESFYEYCIPFNKDGTTFHIKHDLFYFGLAKMFSNIKTYLITEI